MMQVLLTQCLQMNGATGRQWKSSWSVCPAIGVVLLHLESGLWRASTLLSQVHKTNCQMSQDVQKCYESELFRSESAFVPATALSALVHAFLPNRALRIMSRFRC